MKAKGYSTIAGLENATTEEIKRRNMDHYGSKIKKFRKRAGMTAEQLAEVLQISKSSVRNWECGLTRPDPEFLFRMFSILDVEPNEFFGFRGIGMMLTVAEQNLLEDYRSLDRRGREDLSSIAGILVEKAHLRLLRNEYRLQTAVPCRGRAVAAGSVTDEWQDHPDPENVILFESRDTAAADEIFLVSGDSMEPQFSDGDRVLVRYSADVRVGDIGIFYVPGIGGVIKQKLSDRLHSLNPAFDDIIVREEGARVIGIVLGRVEPEMIPGPARQKLYQEALALAEKNPGVFAETEP